MKTYSSFFVIKMLLLISPCALGTIRTVSNNPATLGQFNTIQAAIDASADDDTVYVHGSPNTYALFTVMDKSVTIIGPGWEPDKNMPFKAVVDGCSLRNSPAAGSPSGTELHGLVFSDGATIALVHNTGPDLGFGNLRIIRCQLGGITYFNLSSTNVLFEGCFITTLFNFSSSSTYENFLFQNNIFRTNPLSNVNINMLILCVNVRFDHNLFYSNESGATPIFANNCRSITLTNNIFVERDPAANLSLSIFNNNITYNGGSTNANEPWAVNNNVDGGANIANQNPQMSAQASVDAGTINPLLDFSISSGPANNAGADGKDIGLLYDAVGSLNWANSRNSRLPRIYSMNIINPTIGEGGSLNVSVEARKSN